MLNIQGVDTAAGFAITEKISHPHLTVEVPEELERSIFPWVEDALHGTAGLDNGTRDTLKLLRSLRKFVIIHYATIYTHSPGSALFRHLSLTKSSARTSFLAPPYVALHPSFGYPAAHAHSSYTYNATLPPKADTFSSPGQQQQQQIAYNPSPFPHVSQAHLQPPAQVAALPAPPVLPAPSPSPTSATRWRYRVKRNPPALKPDDLDWPDVFERIERPSLLRDTYAPLEPYGKSYKSVEDVWKHWSRGITVEGPDGKGILPPIKLLRDTFGRGKHFMRTLGLDTAGALEHIYRVTALPRSARLSQVTKAARSKIPVP
ncbi:hypothetical protein JCM8547_001498 [Rhodosporidiobolus lusitaniae]